MTHHQRRFSIRERRLVHAVLARFVATSGYSDRPSSGPPPRDYRSELGVDLCRGVEHRRDIRFQDDRDNRALHVCRESVRLGLRIIEGVLVTQNVAVRSTLWSCFLHSLGAHVLSLAVR